MRMLGTEPSPLQDQQMLLTAEPSACLQNFRGSPCSSLTSAPASSLPCQALMPFGASYFFQEFFYLFILFLFGVGGC